MGVKVGTTLATAQALSREGVLKDLLEAKGLDDVAVDGPVKTQAALVGAERRVELNPVAAVDADRSGVIDPGDAEEDLPLGLYQALK